jgi:tellurite resistance protein TehA-like permease
VLAASRIVDMSKTPMVLATRPVIAGSSVVFWAFASWLVPALVLMGWWRHVQQRVPLRYETGLWAMVFPLGMYAVASMDLGQADRLPVVTAVGSWFLWIAAAAWIAVAVAGILVAGGAVAKAVQRVRRD